MRINAYPVINYMEVGVVWKSGLLVDSLSRKRNIPTALHKNIPHEVPYQGLKQLLG